MASSQIKAQKRLFLALPLDIFRDEITLLLDQCRKRLPQVKWVRPAGVHVTLHFFGNTDSEKIPALESLIQSCSEPFPAFNLNLENLGCFPNTLKPRVLWLGLGGETERLTQLQKNISQALETRGFEIEKRPFVPHATLARCPRVDPSISEGLKSLRLEKTRSKSFHHLILFESHRGPEGSLYEEVQRFSLA
ncbi:MAG: RNA 2',3'-cyclic phosphodiesterase [Candidatus Omnitrophica bacterium]|nr:RNA 2',3'-cyclic phosphodiesterase [Candidatus Omnitrophota bacterium]